ncbi:MAG: hypothetical protein ACJAS1_000831 [Oleiphilaceae bacterium]|jgi:hypothetical protein
MPQFSHNTPATPSDLLAARRLANINQKHFPIGVIGESSDFAWGFNGYHYYVTEGAFCFLVSKAHLSIDEAKQLFSALSFIDASEPSAKSISLAVKLARKQRLSGDNLMWFFADKLDA